MNSNDDSKALVDRVKAAYLSKQPLKIQGGNSKANLGNQTADTHALDVLSTLSHSGVITYEPTELVVTVRSGTLMTSLQATLEESGQQLPFDPPRFPDSTIGGILACGLSGPSRPFSGAARDYVLGTRIINGRGQDLSFGGQVMKNVAGYDVSRLQTGAWGTLGVLLDVSMKVLPRAEMELTLVFDETDDGHNPFLKLLRQSLPLSGAMIIGKQRYLRLSGSASAVQAAANTVGGEALPDGQSLWSSVRDHTHEFFKGVSRQEGSDINLWRISVADHVAALPLQGEWLQEWAGAQRWLKTGQSSQQVFAAARAAGGHATRYNKAPVGESAFQPMDAAMARLQSRVRDSLDPDRLFNPGRYYAELERPAVSMAIASD